MQSELCMSLYIYITINCIKRKHSVCKALYIDEEWNTKYSWILNGHLLRWHNFVRKWMVHGQLCLNTWKVQAIFTGGIHSNLWLKRNVLLDASIKLSVVCTEFWKCSGKDCHLQHHYSRCFFDLHILPPNLRSLYVQIKLIFAEINCPRIIGKEPGL